MSIKKTLAQIEVDLERARLNNRSVEVETLERQREELIAVAWDYAYELACDFESPSSMEFERVRESIYEGLVS